MTSTPVPATEPAPKTAPTIEKQDGGGGVGGDRFCIVLGPFKVEAGKEFGFDTQILRKVILESLTLEDGEGFSIDTIAIRRFSAGKTAPEELHRDTPVVYWIVETCPRKRGQARVDLDARAEPQDLLSARFTNRSDATHEITIRVIGSYVTPAAAKP